MADESNIGDMSDEGGDRETLGLVTLYTIYIDRETSIMMRGANNQQLGGHKTFVFLFIHVSRLKYQNYIPMFHKLI